MNNHNHEFSFPPTSGTVEGGNICFLFRTNTFSLNGDISPPLVLTPDSTIMNFTIMVEGFMDTINMHLQVVFFTTFVRVGKKMFENLASFGIFGPAMKPRGQYSRRHNLDSSYHRYALH